MDDDADIARVFVDVLADCGVSAVAADHERLPEDDLISLVITDLKHCNGYSSDAAVRWVEQLRERYRAPVIVVTGRSEALADETLARVAADVMGKPIDMDDFVMRVGKALGE